MSKTNSKHEVSQISQEELQTLEDVKQRLVKQLKDAGYNPKTNGEENSQNSTRSYRKNNEDRQMLVLK